MQKVYLKYVSFNERSIRILSHSSSHIQENYKETVLHLNESSNESLIGKKRQSFYNRPHKYEFSDLLNEFYHDW